MPGPKPHTARFPSAVKNELCGSLEPRQWLRAWLSNQSSWVHILELKFCETGKVHGTNFSAEDRNSDLSKRHLIKSRTNHSPVPVALHLQLFDSAHCSLQTITDPAPSICLMPGQAQQKPSLSTLLSSCSPCSAIVLQIHHSFTFILA